MAYRGRPIITLRLPREYIAGLKILAREEGTTVSDLLRDLIKGELDAHHISVEPKPLEGQIRV